MWRHARRLAALAAAAIGLLAAIMLINDWRFRSKQIDVPPAPVVSLPEQEAIERLSAAVRLATVSERNEARRATDEFLHFQQFLEQSFLHVHRRLVRRTGTDFGDDRNLSLLFEWTGSEPQLDAVLLMAHYDVVGVDPASADAARNDVEDERLGASEQSVNGRWTHPPFAGHVDDQFVWGRGTLDCKNGVLAILEAVEHLLREEPAFEPRRTTYIALGHDEELGGSQGNKQIAEWMRSQNIRLQFVLDEGGCIFTEFPGLDRPVALIGVAEKGYATVRLVAEAEGGHSSMPPHETAIGILAAALERLEHNQPPRRLDGGAGLMLDHVGPEMPGFSRLAIANRWLLAPAIAWRLGDTRSGNAALRTTMVPSIVSGGFKDNVVPFQAEATVNIRVLPGDTVDSALAHLKETLADERIALHLQPESRREASRISSTDSDAFRTLHTAVKEVFPDVVVAPFVLVGGTDAAHYDDASLSRDVYRFLPARLAEGDLARIHGSDERIARDDYLNIVRFYIRLIRRTSED